METSNTQTNLLNQSLQNVNIDTILHGEPVEGAKNLQAITVYTNKINYQIEPNKDVPMKTRLLIDRKTGKMTEESRYHFLITKDIPENETNLFTSKNYSAFLGVIQVLDRHFLVLCSSVVQVCTIEKSEVYHPITYSFLPFDNDKDLAALPNAKEIFNYLQHLRSLLIFGHYFSYTYDLTQSKQRKSTSNQSDSRFLWNKSMLKDFKKYKIGSEWALPLIQGFIGTFTTKIQGKELVYHLISRRSCLKAGTRYHARGIIHELFLLEGIDDDGVVANFVETEQIISYDGYCCSHVQIRGSVPIFFQQRGITAATKINRNFSLTNQAFLNHFDELSKTYGYSFCVNLLSKTKKEEQMLTEAFEIHVNNNNLSNVKYEFFDFHFHTKGNKFEKLNSLVLKFENLIQKFKFYAEDTQVGAPLINQEGVFRTNCLDCLDRTNFVQTKIAIIVFELQMKQLGIDMLAVFGKDALSQLDNDNLKQQHPFIVSYKTLWADNGDYLSMHYAGTGSTISNVTRTGKQNFFGILEHASKSLGRFYNSNFEDSSRQECIELLTGTHADTLMLQNDHFDRYVKKYEKYYTKTNDLSVFIVTWNLGAYEPKKELDLSDLLNFDNNPSPDILVFGFQEFVDLNMMNMMSNDQSKSKLWIDFLTQAIEKYGKYAYVRSQSLVGLLLIIFAKDTVWSRISRLEADTVKTGLAGTVGNKGAVVIKFNIDDSSLVFVNVHMEAGGKATKERLANLSEFHSRAFQQNTGVGKKREEKIMSLDIKFVFGDTNFRINNGHSEVKAIIEEYNNHLKNGKEEEAKALLRGLLDQDQLNCSKDHEIVKLYKEGEITFLPTYKYDANSQVYDTSKKQRTPSWTDRILWNDESDSVKQKYYTRKEYIESDHRPVISYMTMKTKSIDHEKREEIIALLCEKGLTPAKALREKEIVEIPNLDIVV